jgi:hypothetical protein
MGFTGLLDRDGKEPLALEFLAGTQTAVGIDDARDGSGSTV